MNKPFSQETRKFEIVSKFNEGTHSRVPWTLKIEKFVKNGFTEYFSFGVDTKG